MAGKSTNVRVVLVTDENYALPTTVVVTSIRENRNPDNNYSIHILTVGLSDQSKEKMLSLNEKGFEVKIIERALSNDFLKMKQVRGRVTPAAMMKFELPELFSQYDRILYLDSDMLVQKDLADLFNTDLGDNYAAVVKDILTYRRKDEHLKWLKFEPQAYFNSGMMLLNLKKMREDDITFRLIDYRRYGLNRFTDQDALNVVFGTSVKYISPYNNLLPCFFEWEPLPTLRSFYQEWFPSNLEKIYAKATVLHFGDKRKPWKYDIGYLSNLYRKYYMLSPYKDEPLVLEEWHDQISNSTIVFTGEKKEFDGPAVTVVMPSLNVAPYIRKCIESALFQSLRNIEVLCVDAGSTDGTLEILREYEAKDDRVRVILSEMKSYGHQVNLGIKNAKGKYLAILETDDYILPGMYEDLFKICETNSLDLIKADYYRFSESSTPGKDIRIYWNIIRADNVPYNRVLDSNENMAVFRTGNIPWAGLYNLEFLRDNDIWLNESPGASYQDNGLWFQVMSKAHRVYFVNKPYYCLRRDNPNSSFYSRGKVFAICNEYDFIRSVLAKSPALEKRFAPTCALFRYRNCKWTQDRIAEEFKPEFFQRVAEDFRKIIDAGELDQTLFGKSELEDIYSIVEDPIDYYYNRSKQGYEFYRLLPPDRYEQALAAWYKSKTKLDLDLSAPVLFTDKIQWIKLYYRTELSKRLSDQLEARAWADEKLGKAYLPELLGVWDSTDAVEFEKLPRNFTLRANNGRGYTAAVINKDSTDLEALKAKAGGWLDKNFALRGGMELLYADIQPRLYAESFIGEPHGMYTEYNFYCFNGIPEMVRLIWGMSESDRADSYLDMNWNPLAHQAEIQRTSLITPPPLFSEMKAAAARLAEGFAFVCIAFQTDGKQIYFRELSFTPGSDLITWNNTDLNTYFGDRLHLPAEKTPLPEKSFAEAGVPALPDPIFNPETDVWNALENESRQKEDQIMKNTVLRGKLQKAERDKVYYQNLVNEIMASRSYKLARGITWCADKVRKVINKITGRA